MLEPDVGTSCVAAYELESEGAGYFSRLLTDAKAGMLYRFRLDGENMYPDPASRFQPEGPHVFHSGR